MRLPDPVPVELAATDAALVVMDMTEKHCGRRPQCRETVSAVTGLVERFRAADAPVVYTLGPGGGSGSGPSPSVLGAAGPRAADLVVEGRADKFHGTHLEATLAELGVGTVVLVGTSANGAVLYSAYAAGLRGFTVVVPVDGVSADDDVIRRAVLWQLLNQPGLANPGNEPLARARVTLTTSGNISLTV